MHCRRRSRFGLAAVLVVAATLLATVLLPARHDAAVLPVLLLAAGTVGVAGQLLIAERIDGEPPSGQRGLRGWLRRRNR